MFLGQKSRLFFKTYQIHEGLRWYQGLFPHFASVDSQWTILASSLFGRICHHDTQLLPLVKRATTDNVPGPNRGQSDSKEPIRCFWLSPSQGFFNTMPMCSESDQKRCNILLQIGFKLLYSSQTLFADFKKAATNVREISPEAVIKFLRQGTTNIGTLPCPVKETAIGSVLSVLEILYYCMKSTNFAAVMSGLPLLLTEDGVLRCFQEAEPVFLSRFYDLVPHKSSLFIHHAISEPLIEENIFATNQRVLKKFDIPALALLLSETKHDSWYEANNLIPWDKNKWPSQKWLQLLWKFIFDIYREDWNKFSLKPLEQWPVVPTLSGMLSPVSKGKVILDLTSEETWSARQRKVVRLLRKLGCHEVDAKLTNCNGVRDLSPLLKPYLSQPNSCRDVLRVLDHQMKQTNISGILSEDEVVVILQFLQEDVFCKRQHLVIFNNQTPTILQNVSRKVC